MGGDVMRTVGTVAFALASLAISGCVGLDGSTVVSVTEMHSVTPANGVWDSEYGKTSDPADCSFRFCVLRRVDGIQVKASVLDDKIVTDDCKIGSVSCPSWDDDNIECFFDGDNDKAKDSRSGGVYYGGEYTLVANGAAQSDNSSQPRGFGKSWTGVVARRELSDGRFLLEYDLWFSWKCLGYVNPPDPHKDVTFGFNICVHDDDDGGRADHALYWKGNPVLPYRDESAFGTLTLKGL